MSELFNKAYIRICNSEKAIKGFKATGICPYNPDVFSAENFAPAELQEVNEIRTFNVTEHERTPEPEKPFELNVVEIGDHQGLSDNEESQRSAFNITFRDLSAVPEPSKTQPTNRKTSTKQHSQIVTSTPNKKILEHKKNNKILKRGTSIKKATKRLVQDRGKKRKKHNAVSKRRNVRKSRM